MGIESPLDTKHNHDLWEAWIDVQDAGKNHRGTLYIIGDVVVSNKLLRPFLVRKEDGTAPEGELFLEVIPQTHSDEGRLIEVFYSEELDSPNQYRSVTIFSGKHIIARINEIEVLI